MKKFSLILLAFASIVACENSREFNDTDAQINGASDDLSMSDEKLLNLKNYAAKAGFPQWDLHRATCIILCESGGRPDARSGVHVGLFQINETYPGTEGGRGVKHPTQAAWDARGKTCGSQLEDPQINADCAFIRLSRAGWKDWDCGGAVPSLLVKVEACIDRLDKRLGK